jgi:hypothetical protein
VAAGAAPARDRTVHCSIGVNAPGVNADGGSPHHGGRFLAVGPNPEEDVMKNRNKWIAKAAALVGLVGGLAGTADATMLSAGGFPTGAFTGIAYCVLTNDGIRDVTVNSMHMYDGATGNDEYLVDTPQVVNPGKTLQIDFLWSNFGHPNSCTFDVSTKSGVRASFVFDSGSSVTVIPAVAK